MTGGSDGGVDELAAAEGDAAADGETEAEPGDVNAVGTEALGEKSGPAKPPVGTRTAAQLKADADNAFKEARLGRAIALYGRALKADAAAEWMEGTEVGGLLFRCQCLANRAVS